MILLWRTGIMPVSDFSDTQKNQKDSILPKKLRLLSQHLNHLKNNLNREKHKMKQQRQSDRKARVRQFIQCAGLLQRSGLMEAFQITPGEDLQDYENREKASQLLGFLSECFEKNNFDEVHLERWRSLGERLLKYN